MEPEIDNLFFSNYKLPTLSKTVEEARKYAFRKLALEGRSPNKNSIIVSGKMYGDYGFRVMMVEDEEFDLYEFVKSTENDFDEIEYLYKEED